MKYLLKKIEEKWLVVITVLLGTFSIILNNSMLNPAIPYLMDIFNSDAVTMSWIITIFMVMMGVTMPITGYLGDRFGKKQLYIAGLILFLIGSILGSLSWDITSLIIFRSIQGIGGGMMMPTSMALIFQVFPRNERGLATGIYGIAAMIAPTIGPTLGGFLIEMGSWQWLFLCNVPFTLIGVIFAVIYLKQTEIIPNISFDISGFITVTIGVGSILFALGRISEFTHLKNPVNFGLIVVGTLMLYIFAKIERNKEQPLLDLSIFNIRAFTYSVIISSVSSIGLFGGIFLLPLLMQNVYGYDAILTGLVFLPSALFSGIFMSIGGRTLDRKGPTFIVTAGMAITAISTAIHGFLTMETALIIIFLLNVFRGIGMGLCSMPATTAGMNIIPESFISRGSAMNNILRQMSSAFGIVFVSIFFEVRRSQLLLKNIDLTEATFQAISEGFIVIGIILFLCIPIGLLLGKEYEKEQWKIERGKKMQKKSHPSN